MRTRSLVALSALAACLAGCGSGGSGDVQVPALIPGWNLDFVDSYPVPATYGGASGQIGTWAACNSGPNAGRVNVNGVATALSVSLAGRNDTFNTPATDTGRLLAGSVVNDSFPLIPPPVAFSCTIDGLPAGTYDLFYYHFGATSGLQCNGVGMGALTADSSATARDVLGVQGTNWNVFRVSVAAGQGVVINDTTAADSYGLGGIQIVPVAGP
jgi:hypothetical protein